MSLALRRTLALLVVPAAAVTLAAPAFASPAPLSGAGVSAQGIIMRDGGVCDPIRHMGC